MGNGCFPCFGGPEGMQEPADFDGKGNKLMRKVVRKEMWPVCIVSRDSDVLLNFKRLPSKGMFRKANPQATLQVLGKVQEFSWYVAISFPYSIK